MASGRADKVKGRIKKAVGDLTDDPKLRRRGQVDETAGKIKDTVEKGVDKAKDNLNKP
jgi:uncharacterized protein YjbJ (UPF0337 family)